MHKFQLVISRICTINTGRIREIIILKNTQCQLSDYNYQPTQDG